MLYFAIQWQSVQKSVAVGISQLPRVKFRSSDIVEGWERAVQRNEIVGKKKIVLVRLTASIKQGNITTPPSKGIIHEAVEFRAVPMFAFCGITCQLTKTFLSRLATLSSKNRSKTSQCWN